MTTPDSFYITTPIYYVNDVPHLGHAYTTTVADAFARYYRRTGRSTYFVTGTDEHGQKIENAAAERGMTPQALADEVVERFRGLWNDLGISNDDFIRTTEERHKAVARDLWQRMVDRGDIYLGSYSGWYCVGCEAYYTEKEIEDKVCPYGHGKIEHREEPSYFFRLSAFQDRLLDLYDRPDDPFVRPESRLNEVRSFVAGGLQDLSISRTTISWGIDVPDAQDHVMYVWLDALSNYVSVLGGVGSDLYERHWPASVHLIGKDILRFHAVFWPAFLMSADLPLPDSIVAHGWWTVEGQKMSKSLRNVVDPHFLIDEYGIDVVRYFMMREVPLGLDGDFSHENVLNRINADLANDLGNLVSRTLGMAGKFLGGQMPDPAAAQGGLASHCGATRTAVRGFMDDRMPHMALADIWELVGRANKYVDEQAPWALAKNGKNDQVAAVLAELLCTVAWVGVLLDPFMPDTSAQILDAVQARLPDGWTFADLADDIGRFMQAGVALGSPPPMFPRIDDKEKQKRLDRIKSLSGAGTDDGDQGDKEDNVDETAVTIDDFFRTELRVAEIKAAEPIPKSNKLLKLSVDAGEGTDRTVVAGLAKAYESDALVGKRVLLVANLKPAKLMGVESNGMVLAGETADGGLQVVEPPANVPVGTRIK